MNPLPLFLLLTVLGSTPITAADLLHASPPETKLVKPTHLITAEKFDPEQWYPVTIEVRGDVWFARVGTHTLTARHERFQAPKGRIRLVAKGEGAQFKDVAIWHAQPEP